MDAEKAGHKLANIAAGLRGQAALAREVMDRDIFSCVLDGMAEQVDEIAAPMLEISRSEEAR
jgi:hypothetical protein